MKLLTVNNTKTLKGEKLGYLTAILHLLPYTLSGFNVCPKASAGCSKACLNTAGMGKFSNVQLARKKRTLMYFNKRSEFETLLIKEIGLIAKRAIRLGVKPAIRINGTSDLPMLAIKMALLFPDIQFYDYTKILKTFNRELPKNYHLTFSRSENNQNEVLEVLKRGNNVAMVFNKLPKTYLGYEVINGDETDLRFLDKQNVIVGLSMKADAKKDVSGFVVNID